MDENFTLTGEAIRLEYQLEKQDLIDALRAIENHNSFWKRIFQSVVAAILVIGFAYSYLKDPTYIQGLILGLLSLVILILVWALPFFSARSTAKLMADQIKEKTVLTLYENGLSGGDGFFCTVMPFEDIKTVLESEKALYLEMKQQKLYVILKSAEGFAENEEIIRARLMPEKA